MAADTYYFFFSIIFVVWVMFYIVNLLFLRLKGKTFYGLDMTPGTPGYKRVLKLPSNRNLTIWGIVAAIFIANPIYDIYRITI